MIKKIRLIYVLLTNYNSTHATYIQSVDGINQNFIKINKKPFKPPKKIIICTWMHVCVNISSFFFDSFLSKLHSHILETIYKYKYVYHIIHIHNKNKNYFRELYDFQSSCCLLFVLIFGHIIYTLFFGFVRITQKSTHKIDIVPRGPRRLIIH